MLNSVLTSPSLIAPQVDLVNSSLPKHGVTDCQVGQVALDRLRKVAALPQVTPDPCHLPPPHLPPATCHLPPTHRTWHWVIT